MGAKKLSVGDRVEIFQKPVTKKESEGWAIIKEIYRRYDTHIDIKVEFEDEPEITYSRTIIF